MLPVALRSCFVSRPSRWPDFVIETRAIIARAIFECRPRKSVYVEQHNHSPFIRLFSFIFIAAAWGKCPGPRAVRGRLLEFDCAAVLHKRCALIPDYDYE